MASSWSTNISISRSMGALCTNRGDASNTFVYSDTSMPGLNNNGQSNGLFVFDSAGTNAWPAIFLSFDLASIPLTTVPYSATVRLTIGAKNLLTSMGLEIYRILKPITLSATPATYDGSNSWYSWYLESMQDYGSLLSTVSIPSTCVVGDTIDIDVSSVIESIHGSNDRVARFMIIPSVSRHVSALTNHEYVRFYTGNQTNVWAYSQWYYAYDGNGTTDLPTLFIEDIGAVSFYLADYDGGFSATSTLVGQGLYYYDAGYVVPGSSSTPWKMYMQNNLAGYLYDVRIWCDWARATVPEFTGSGAATMSYISVINGDPDNGSPTTQLWKMTCLSGGDNSVWSVQSDRNSYTLYGSYTWYDASPATLNCAGPTGVYNSTPNTQGITFSLSNAAPQVNDKFEWQTFQNTVVPGANVDSEKYMLISANAGGPWVHIQPAYSLITTVVSGGGTDIPVTSVVGFVQYDNVLITNMFNGQKYINTISSINVTGSKIVLTGGIISALGPGDQVQISPFGVGNVAPDAVVPFWLSLDVPDMGVGTGIRAVRIQVTEGQ